MTNVEIDLQQKFSRTKSPERRLAMNNNNTNESRLTIGIDVSDKFSQICIIDDKGETIEESRIPTKPNAFMSKFYCAPAQIALEAGTHSQWIDKTLRELGHDVIVANPRKLKMIYMNDSKDDRVDAEQLARVRRIDPKMLAPIQHRKEEEQENMELLKARDILVRGRTDLINHIRGAVKPFGCKLPESSADSFHKKVRPHIPESLLMSLSPLIDTVEEMTIKIKQYNKKIEKIAESKYPITKTLCQVNGVGPLTALAFTLSIGDPYRFKKSRAVGAYLGLRPRRSQSGEIKLQLPITKAGNTFLRRLLVTAAQYILGPFGKDSDLRRWGLMKSQGGKSAKKRAVIGTARKLSVLLHRLSITGEEYIPLKNSVK